MPALQFKFLGGFAAYIDELPLEGFNSDKTRALLSYLIVEADRAHRRDLLAGMFWHEVPESCAHHSLSQALYSLRRLFQSPASCDPLVVTAQTVQYRLDEHTWVDCLEFDRLLAVCNRHPHPEKYTCRSCLELLAEAVVLYRGDFCAGLYVDGSDGFETWLAQQVVTRRYKLFLALEWLIEAYIQLGIPRQALVYAWQRTALDPYGEESQRCLIRLLFQLGMRKEALLRYEQFHQTLRDELDVEPEEATQQLYQVIKTMG